MQPLRMMATTGMLGYGYTEEAFRRGIAQGLDFIAADGGSMDPGPHYLGEGHPFRIPAGDETGYLADAGSRHRSGHSDADRFLTAAGGSEPQLALVRELVEEVAAEKDLHFKMAIIHSEQSPRIAQSPARRRQRSNPWDPSPN